MGTVISLLFFVAARHDEEAWKLPLVCVAVGVVITGVGFCLPPVRLLANCAIFTSPMLPLFCGGVVAGIIRLPKKFRYKGPIRLQLRCLSKGYVVWQDELALDGFDAGAELREIPVYFRVPPPPTAKPTGLYVRWQLVMQRAAVFELPMVDGPVPREVFELPDETVGHHKPAELPSKPTSRHIRFSPLCGGGDGFQVELLPGRNLALGLWGMGFALMFLGLAIMSVLESPSTPWVTMIVLGAGGTVVLTMAASLLLQKTMLIVQGGILGIVNTIGLNRRRKIHAADITDVIAVEQGSSGKKHLYAIYVHRTNAHPIRICGTIYSRNDAEWLVQEMKKSMNQSEPRA